MTGAVGLAFPDGHAHGNQDKGYDKPLGLGTAFNQQE